MTESGDRFKSCQITIRRPVCRDSGFFESVVEGFHLFTA